MSRFESILNKIQNKFKNYCEFRRSCPYFDLGQFTCTSKGGIRCGKYRRIKAEKTTDEYAKPTGII